MKLFSKQKKGFTLVELLVVVAIIALLASIVMASLSKARAKGRDAKRFEDMHNMQVALSLYFNVNGFYPDVGTCDGGDWNAVGWASPDPSGYATCWTTLQTALSPYMKTLPTDPTQNTYYYYYGDFKNGQGYALLAWPEASNLKGNTCHPDVGAGINDGFYCLGENTQ